MYYRKPRSGFARQDCEAGEGVVAASWSGGGNMGTILSYLRIKVHLNDCFICMCFGCL